MICTKKLVFTGCKTIANGVLFVSEAQSLGNFAVAFTDVPTMTLSKISNNGGWIYNHTEINKTKAGNVWFATPDKRTSSSFGCHLIAIGRWK